MVSQTYTTDVAIIGAGPTGLFAVFECGMVGLKTHVIDSLEILGGQCTALYPEKPIYDIPGFPDILAQDLIHNLERQAEPFAPVYHLGQSVQSLTTGTDFTLTTSKGESVKAKAIIIAGGGGSFGPQRPPLEGIESYEGTSVFYAVRRKQDFAGKNIIIAGGGDSALDWAISLSDIATVSLVHRRHKFKAAPASVTKLESLAASGKIKLIVPGQLKALQGANGKLSHVVIENEGNPDQTVPADILLPFFGLSTSLGAVAEWGLNLDRNHIAIDPSTCATNIPGIYAIGDIAAYDKKLKLILTGFAEAAQAAHAIRDRIHPDAPHHFEYSTTKGIPSKA